MNQISYAGLFSSSSLVAPGVYVNVLPPKGSVIRPAVVGVLAMIGIASWGPVNVPTPISAGQGTPLAIFGTSQVRKYDLVTHALNAQQIQAALNSGASLMLQRVTDGTDTAATATIQVTGLTLTSIYSGTAANAASWTISTGSAANTWKLTLSMPNFANEVFDNISGTANALWVNMAQAVNMGNSPQRGPSKLMVATAGALTGAPTAGTGTLSGGTDGTASITPSVLIGTDGTTRKGIYAFRSMGCTHGVVCDLDDHAQNATIATFAQSEGIYWGVQNAAGDTPAAAATQKATDGTDTPWIKYMIGDWVYANDNVNGGQRLLGPATFYMAMQSAQPVQNSGLNKQIPGVVATQRSKSQENYSQADIVTLANAGLDVIANPCPGGNYFGGQTGRNASSNGAQNTDNWPVLTAFVARSLSGPGALGPAIGQVITPNFFTTWYAVLDNFLAGLKGATPSPVIQNYQINFGPQNNPQSQTATGLVVAEVLIQYFGIAMVFLVNLQSGATVVIPQSQSSFANAA